MTRDDTPSTPRSTPDIPDVPVPTMTPVQVLIVSELLSLQKLTRDTGTKTTRTQNRVLRNLSDDDLVVVSRALDYYQQKRGW